MAEDRQYGGFWVRLIALMLDWAVVFVASLPGRAGREPTSKEADQPLQRMIESVKTGAIGAFLPFNRLGEPLLFD